MKKIVLLLLALSLVAGQALFAQDDGLKIDGHVKTGVKIEANNADALMDITDADQIAANSIYGIGHGPANPLHNGKVSEWSGDADSTTELRLNFNYVKENVFAHARFQVHSTDTDVGFAFAYGGFSLLDNLIEISAGMLDVNKWGTFTDFWLDTNLDTHGLVKIAVTPKAIEGLSFGINIFSVPERNDGAKEFSKSLGETVFGVGYAVADFGGRIEFIGWNHFGPWTSRVATPAGFSTLAATAGFTAPTDWTFGALLSGYYYGIENLKLDLDAYLGANTLETVGDDLKSTAFGIGVRGLYTLDKLEVGAKVTFDTLAHKIGSDGVSFWQLGITPQASYSGLMEGLTVGIEIPIGFVDNVSGTGDAKDLVKDTLGWKGGFTIGAKPKATFDLGNGAKFVTFYNLGVYRAGYISKDYMGTGTDPKAPGALVNHTIQFDFIWTF